jgi:NADH-quinone oxidoreductase subunit A
MGAPLKGQTGEDERKFQPQMKHPASPSFAEASRWTRILVGTSRRDVRWWGEATDEPKILDYGAFSAAFLIEFSACRFTFLCMEQSQPSQLAQYIPVLILLVVAVGFAAGTLVTSVLLGHRGKRTRAKDTAYECGKDPIGEGNARFSVKFYLVAMLFILFDIEIVFLYPWAVVYRDMLADHATRNLILGSMVSFLAILFAGYLYALKKKAFDWKS